MLPLIIHGNLNPDHTNVFSNWIPVSSACQAYDRLRKNIYHEEKSALNKIMQTN